MKLKKNVLMLFITIGCLNLNAQKYELGKVSIAELEEKTHPKDSSAVAAVLFSKGEVRFEYSQSDGFIMTTEVSMRIKIYKKEGYEFANQYVVNYILGNSKENISFDNAITYNLVAGKIEKTKLKSDGEFEEKINKYWGRKKITMPNVKEGSVIEFSYFIKSPNIVKFRDWNFQKNIPVNYSEFKTYIPEYFVYNPNQKGFVFPKVVVEKSDKTVTYNYREKNEPGGTIIHSTTQEKLNYIETRTTYTAVNLPAMKDESFVNNIENYTSSISHELSLIKYPNSPYKTYSTDWNSVVKDIYEDDDFGLELKKTGYFEEDIKALMIGLTSREEIIATIFNFVKTNVKWNGFNNYYCIDGVKNAYKNKTGNVSEINLMLTAMLRFAEITANPVLVSTRDNGIALFPNRTAFNYVIAAVETENGLILLDATEKYSLPNILPIRDLNWYGRLIRKDGTSIQVDLEPKSISKENHIISYKINETGTIEGKIRNQITDYNALKFRLTKIGLTKENYLENLENINNSIEISDYIRENDLEISKPIIETYSFKDNSDLEIINGKIYLAPMLFLASKENPFKMDKREYPIDFSFPFQEKYLINIDIPEGYTIESMPKSVNMVTGDDIGSYKYLINNVDNKIQVSILFEMKSAIVGAEYYDIIKDFYQKIVDIEKEKIVLIKK